MGAAKNMAQYHPDSSSADQMVSPSSSDEGGDHQAPPDRARIDFRVLDAKTVLSECGPGNRLYVGHSPRPVMHLVLAGDITVQNGDVSVRASAGDVVLALYGDAHVISTPPSEKITALTLKWPHHAPWNPPYQPPPSGATTSILSYNIELNYLHPTARAVKLFPSIWVHRQIEENGVSRALALDLQQIRESCFGPGAPNVLNNLAGLLFSHAMRCMYRRIWGDRDEQLPVQWERRIGAAITAMEDHPDHPWTVKELARYIGSSRSSFAATFKEAVGETPYSYLRRFRMERARQLVEESTLSVHEIARRLGYPLPSSFSRAYAAYFGAAPKRIRENLRASDLLSAYRH